MINNNSKILTFTIIGIIILIIAYFFGRYIGKRTPPKPIDEPEDIIDPTMPNFNPTSITDNFYNDINGISINKNIENYKAFLNLSDTNAVKVMNDWDKRYFTKWNETLFEAFSKERFITNVNLANSVYQKLNKLETLRKK